MTLQEEIKGIFHFHNVTGRAQAIIEYIHQKRDELEEAKERYEEAGEHFILTGIESELMFIYMLEMSLMRFKQELSITTQEVLDHMEIKEIKKTASDSLQTKEADKKDTELFKK